MRYQVGDEFTATVCISEYNTEEVTDDDEEEGYPYTLTIKELGDVQVEGVYCTEELDVAFDPTYKERMRLQRIIDLENELTELRDLG